MPVAQRERRDRVVVDAAGAQGEAEVWPGGEDLSATRDGSARGPAIEGCGPHGPPGRVGTGERARESARGRVRESAPGACAPEACAPGE